MSFVAQYHPGPSLPKTGRIELTLLRTPKSSEWSSARQQGNAGRQHPEVRGLQRLPFLDTGAGPPVGP